MWTRSRMCNCAYSKFEIAGDVVRISEVFIDFFTSDLIHWFSLFENLETLFPCFWTRENQCVRSLIWCKEVERVYVNLRNPVNICRLGIGIVFLKSLEVGDWTIAFQCRLRLRVFMIVKNAFNVSWCFACVIFFRRSEITCNLWP